ncbi:urease accessory protein UreF [Bradyrhizobium sp. CCBAU 51753]|uniref:urease accessory protein UreF n=1 Tax=Bradyrhizobium sp. CCBAU 51753 TaxID=1325100 RepID=UPI00188C8ED8|nr:urease accessory UreF family protein [Bradyrhizobium sp. CCBAU 51753]QOZ29464.1 urease accessory protein UreF [Bradyrhizobium sp. CCBAU 51753]
MTAEQFAQLPQALLRLQSWLSPSFPNGAYSYSHGLEWAVEAAHITSRASLVDWLEADLCYGSGRNEAIFFKDAYRSVSEGREAELAQLAGLAAAFRGTSEFVLESAQQSSACLATLRQVWPDRILDVFAHLQCAPVLAVVLGARSARERIPLCLALPAFLHSYVANLVMAGVRLIPLGQTDGQLAIAALEHPILALSAKAVSATIDELGSAGLMVELASIAHETQYTRLFRS